MAVILPSVYKDGTATVNNGATTVTGQNTLFINSVLPGDFFGSSQGVWVRIASVDSNTTLTLSHPWPEATQTASAYEIMLQSDNARMQETSRQLLETLSSGNNYSLSQLNGNVDQIPIFSAPGVFTLVSKSELLSGVNFDVVVNDIAGRAAYDNREQGFTVLVINTGDGRSAVYAKNSATTGDWSNPIYITGPVGPAGYVNLRGTYAAGTAYTKNDGVLYNGSSFVALQATTGNAPPTLPTTSNAYWQLLAVKGADGTGIGDMLASNNLSELTNKPQALINIGAAPVNNARGCTVIFDGDSITHHLNASTVDKGFAYLFRDMRFAAPRKAFFNFAQGGNVIGDLAARYAASVKPHRPDANGGDGGLKSYLFVFVGDNDLNILATTASAYLNALTAYVATAKADGFTVIVGTILPYRDAISTGSVQKRIDANASIRRNDIGADIIADIASVLPNAYDIAMFSDGLHPSDAGHRILANYLDDGMTNGKFPYASWVALEKRGGWETLFDLDVIAGGFYAPHLDIYSKLRISGRLNPNNNTSEMYLQFSADNGANYLGCDYAFSTFVGTTRLPPTKGNSSIGMSLSGGRTVFGSQENGFRFELVIEDWNRAAYKVGTLRSTVIDYDPVDSQLSMYAIDGRFQYRGNTPMNAIRIVPGSFSGFDGHLMVEGWRG